MEIVVDSRIYGDINWIIDYMIGCSIEGHVL